MLGTKLDVRPFLERVGQELMRVDVAEVRALADAIYLVLGNPELASKLGQCARERVEEHYTIEREVNDHIRLYGEILGNPRA